MQNVKCSSRDHWAFLIGYLLKLNFVPSEGMSALVLSALKCCKFSEVARMFIA